MPKNCATLRRLLAPVDVATFESMYWETEPLLIDRTEPEYYSGLLSVSDVERIVPVLQHIPDALRLVRQGETLALPRSLDKTDAVFAMFQDGATIILQGLHRYWAPLTTFCNSLAEELSHPVQVNAYLTPSAAGDTRGLGRHFDVHDVFVLQLSGAKHWRMYESPLPIPLENDSYRYDPSRPEKPKSEFDIDPGDCLYIPRGHVHEAMVMSEQSASLHLTIGIKSLTWMDLIQAVLQVSGPKNVALRKALPIGFAREPEYQRLIQRRFGEVLEHLVPINNVQSALDQLIDDLLHHQQSTLTDRFADVFRRADLDLETHVYHKAGIAFRIRQGDGKIFLAFQGKEIEMPRFLEPTLLYVARTSDFCPGQLPGSLDDSSKITFVRRLICEGFLTFGRQHVYQTGDEDSSNSPRFVNGSGGIQARRLRAKTQLNRS